VPDLNEEAFIQKVQDTLSDKIESVEGLQKNHVILVVKKESLIEVAEILRDEYGFIYPSAAGGMDYPNDNRMQMIYYVMNPETSLQVILKVNVPRDDLVLPTMTVVWDAMSYHEREAWEMFGFDFEGHDNMIPLLLPPDWKGGHPLRKDFKGEGVTE